MVNEMYEMACGRTTYIYFEFFKAKWSIYCVAEASYMDSCVPLELPSFMDSCLIVVPYWRNSGSGLLQCHLGAVTLLKLFFIY